MIINLDKPVGISFSSQKKKDRLNFVYDIIYRDIPSLNLSNNHSNIYQTFYKLLMDTLILNKKFSFRERIEPIPTINLQSIYLYQNNGVGNYNTQMGKW